MLLTAARWLCGLSFRELHFVRNLVRNSQSLSRNLIDACSQESLRASQESNFEDAAIASALGADDHVSLGVPESVASKSDSAAAEAQNVLQLLGRLEKEHLEQVFQQAMKE